MKMLMAINSLVIGGAERVFVEQVNQLIKNNIEVWVLTTVKEGSKNFRKELNLPAAKAVQLNFKGFFDLKSWWQLHQFFHQHNFEAVVSYLFLTNTVVRIMAWLHRLPVICSYEQNVYLKKTKQQQLVDRILAKFTDIIFAVSQEVLNFTSQQEKIKKEKFFVLYNAIKLETKQLSEAEKLEVKIELGIPPNALMVSTAGRLVEQKGQIYLIKAAHKVLAINKDKEIYFLIAGQGGLKEALIKEANLLAIGERVKLPGVLPINQLLAITDIFVLPSLWEGLSLVMLEAMAYGKPLVVTNVSGASEVIKDGQSGYLVPPKDSRLLADKISALINDSALRQKFSQAVLEKVKNFSIERNVEILIRQLTEVYQHKSRTTFVIQ